MEFQIEYPDGKSEVREIEVVYSKKDADMWPAIRKQVFAYVARNLIPRGGPAGWTIYYVFVAGELQYKQSQPPYGVDVKRVAIRDGADAEGAAKLYGTHNWRDRRARNARFALDSRNGRDGYTEWLRPQLWESVSTWAPPDIFQSLSFEKYFEVNLHRGFLFASAARDDVVVRANDLAREVYQRVRGEVISEKHKRNAEEQEVVDEAKTQSDFQDHLSALMAKPRDSPCTIIGGAGEPCSLGNFRFHSTRSSLRPLAPEQGQ